jgi:uncharacterized protein
MYLTPRATIHRLNPDQSLLINALSGAVDIVDNELRTKLLELGLGRRPALSDQEAESLTERGYLFPDGGQERAAFLEMHQAYQAEAARRPLQFVVCPTYSCNLACSYCFETEQLRSKRQVMAEEHVPLLFQAIDEIAATRPDRKRQLVLFGGEPLLPGTETVVDLLLRRAGEKGFAVQLVTNGTHLPRFAHLFRLHAGTVKGAQITLDGPQPVHDVRRRTRDGRGSFADAVTAVEVCLEMGIAVNLRVNLDGHNLPYLEALAAFFQEKGWAGQNGFRCQLAPVTDHLGTSCYPFLLSESELVEPVLELWERRPELRKALDFRLFRVLYHLISVIEDQGRSPTMPRFHYCEADRGDVYTFGPDGFIYVCTESIGDRKLAVGRYAPIFRLWPRKLQRWHGRSVLSLPECQQCTIATFCGGGCAYAALKRLGTTKRPVCGDAPSVVQAYLERLRRRYQMDSRLAPVG